MNAVYDPDPDSPFILELSRHYRSTRTQYGAPVQLEKTADKFRRVRPAKFSERHQMQVAQLQHEADTRPFITELRPKEAGAGPYPDGDWTRIDPITGKFDLPDGVFELLRLTGVMVSLDVVKGFKLYYKHPSGSTYVCCYKIKSTIEDWASACQHLMNHAEERVAICPV